MSERESEYKDGYADIDPFLSLSLSLIFSRLLVRLRAAARRLLTKPRNHSSGKKREERERRRAASERVEGRLSHASERARERGEEREMES